MDATAVRVALEDFLALPEPQDGTKLEYWDGEVVRMPPAGARHGSITRRLGARLGDFVDRKGLGEVLTNDSGFLVGTSILGPDVSWIAAGRFSELPVTHFDGPPDLAVEVVSPSDLDSRVAEKVAMYLAAGVARVWIVRPAQQTVTVRAAGGAISELHGDQELTSDDAGFNAPGFTLKVSDIFGPLPER